MKTAQCPIPGEQYQDYLSQTQPGYRAAFQKNNLVLGPMADTSDCLSGLLVWSEEPQIAGHWLGSLQALKARALTKDNILPGRRTKFQAEFHFPHTSKATPPSYLPLILFPALKHTDHSHVKAKQQTLFIP